MWKKVEIENFQSHKNTVMEFAPGINVIIGESDAGKSAIINLINWICKNRPLGDVFRSEWGGDTRAALYAMEGNVVERIRTATRNEYVINNQVLSAFGSKVPEEVTNLLQIDSVNIHEQMDRPFLLSSTPGEAAQMLNKAAAIDDIDHVTSELRKSYTKINNDIKYDAKQLKENNEKIKQYENIPVIEDKIKTAEELEVSYNEKSNNLENLKQTVTGIKRKEFQLKATDHVPGLMQKYTAAENIYTKYQNKSDRYQKLNDVINKITEVEDILNSTAYVDNAMQIVKDVEGKILTYTKKQKQVNEIRGMLSRVKNTESQVDKIQKVIGGLQKEFDKLFPDVCPLCGK